MTHIRLDQLITALHLQPLEVEGGLHAESYRSALQFGLHAGHPHLAGSAIYFLLTSDPDSFSAMHRLPSDEVYHFYLGDPIELLLLEPGQPGRRVVLGQDLLAGQHVQFVVPAGAWQGSRLLPGGSWALLGTTMAPGFIPEDFELGDRLTLEAQFPEQIDAIRRLVRPPVKA